MNSFNSPITVSRKNNQNNQKNKQVSERVDS